MFLCTKGTNNTISASGRHDFLHDSYLARMARMIRFPQAEDTILCTNGTISASGIHDTTRFLSCTKGTNNTISASGIHDFSSCHSCKKKIVLSTYRHRAIRAIRARKNRVVDLSTSYHSCHSCEKKSCSRLVDIVLFVHKISCRRLVDIVPFVLR